MARGTVVGEAVVSQANTRDFDAGYDRVFGAGKKVQRGRFIWDPEKKAMVSAAEYVEPVLAKDAPIASGRFYENQKMLDGADVGSRKRYNEYLKVRGLTHSDDFKEQWKKDAERRAKFYTQGGDAAEHKARREIVGKAFYEHVTKGKRRS